MPKEKYLLQQPQSLESMAMMRLGDWIASQAYDLAFILSVLRQYFPAQDRRYIVSRQIKIIRDHIQRRVSRIFHDQLLNELKRAINELPLDDFYVKDIRKRKINRIIETLLTKKLSSLSFDLSDWDKYEHSFLMKLDELTGLTQLSLTIHCTEDILKRIVKNCKLITFLNLSSSSDLNDAKIDILIKLNNLKSIDLRSTAVSAKGIEKILMSCGNIEHIKTSFVNLAQVFAKIVVKHPKKRFRLKSYENEGETSLEQHRLVVKMCPFIQKLTLLKDEDIIYWEDYINALHDLKYLRDLELSHCEFYRDRLKELLQARGSTLERLCLENASEINLAALKHIYATCPNLQELVLGRCLHINDTPVHCAALQNPLKKLERICLVEFIPTFPEDQLIFLLSNCPNIGYIDVGGLIRNMDNVITQILEQNPTNFKYLKELKVRRLSEHVMDRIILNSVHSPEVIVRLPSRYGW